MYKACICLLVGFATAAWAMPDGTTQSTDNKSGSNGTAHHHTEMQNAKAKLSTELSSMLQSTQQARTAISQKDEGKATKDVNQALNVANEASSQHSGTDLVPLYTELMRMSVVGPILKRHQSNATASASNGSSQNGASQSGSADRSTAKAAQNRPLGVHEVVGGVTSVFLDLNAAQKHLQAAQQALSQNDLKQADKDLQAVEDSVVVESVAADMPLLRAREDLVLARDNAELGRYQRSQAELRAASRALNDYDKTGASHGKDA